MHERKNEQEKHTKPPNPAIRLMISHPPPSADDASGAPRWGRKKDAPPNRKNVPPTHFHMQNAGRYDARCHPYEVTSLSTLRLQSVPLRVYRIRVARRPAGTRPAAGLVRGRITKRRHVLRCCLVLRELVVVHWHCPLAAGRRLPLRLPVYDIEALGAPVFSVSVVEPVSSLAPCGSGVLAGCLTS